jgi:hypothetical protein
VSSAPQGAIIVEMIPRQPSPYVGSPFMSSAAGVPTPVVIPVQKTNLQLLYEATPLVKMPPPLERDAFPACRFWEESKWAAWAKEEKEKGSFKSRVQGEGVNSSWMEDEKGNRVDLPRQQVILAEARHTWVTMKSFKVDFAVYHDTPVPTLDYFRAKMEMGFRELRLCADHWKANKAWKENFSSWTGPPQEPQPRPEMANILQSLACDTF